MGAGQSRQGNQASVESFGREREGIGPGRPPSHLASQRCAIERYREFPYTALTALAMTFNVLPIVALVFLNLRESEPAADALAAERSAAAALKVEASSQAKVAGRAGEETST